MDQPDLNNMGPEEIEALQKQNCVFCHISDGKVPAKKVYEDDICIGLLDINPASAGHILLMPREHHTVMFQVPDSILEHLYIIAKGLSKAQLKALQTKGTTIFAANGTAAGQRAPHFMLHVIPRAPDDKVGIYIPSRALPESEAKKIIEAISEGMGKKKTSNLGTGIKKEHKKVEEKVEREKEKVVDAEIVEEKEEVEEGAVEEEGSELDRITELLSGKKDGGSK
jgi:histidine triad (HIT) family protein